MYALQQELERQQEREAVYDGPLSYPKPLQERPAVSSKPSKNAEKESRPAGLGLGQIAIGIGSLALVAVFVITSGGSPAPDTSAPQAQVKAVLIQQRCIARGSCFYRLACSSHVLHPCCVKCKVDSMTY